MVYKLIYFFNLKFKNNNKIIEKIKIKLFEKNYKKKYESRGPV